MKTLEEVATVQRARGLVLSRPARCLECGGVTRQRIRRQTDLILPAGYEYVRAKLLPERRKRLAQDPPGMVFIGIGPEVRDQRVPADELPPPSTSDEHQQRQPLLLDVEMALAVRGLVYNCN